MFRPTYNPARLFTCILIGATLSLLLALAGPTISAHLTPTVDRGTSPISSDVRDIYRLRSWLTTTSTACFSPRTGRLLSEGEHIINSASYERTPYSYPGCDQHEIMPSFNLIESGWPMRSLSARRVNGNGTFPFILPPSPADTTEIPSPQSPDEIRDSGWLQLRRGQLTLTIPTTPHALPFLINALTCSALCWLLAQTLLQLRATLRRARNRCPHCNYSLTLTPPHMPCPECGHHH